MENLQFTDEAINDMTEAYDNSVDIVSAIEGLQSTSTWLAMPIETRRILCAAHAHTGALAFTLGAVV